MNSIDLTMMLRKVSQINLDHLNTFITNFFIENGTKKSFVYMDMMQNVANRQTKSFEIKISDLEKFFLNQPELVERIK